MNFKTIERQFRDKVCNEIYLKPEGIERYRVFTPFLLEDGDHPSIVLKKDAVGWAFSDEGHTFMHLTYDIDEKDLHRGTRQQIITNALSAFQVKDRDGELILPVYEDSYGDALYSFIQAILRISDTSFLTRERIKSTFYEDFRAVISSFMPKDRLTFDWHDSINDPQGMYTVDCMINNKPRPLFVYALLNDDKARDATIAMLQFERWDIPFRSMAVFQNQESINRKILARFSDVCEKQFSNLAANRERIKRYVKEVTSDVHP